MKVTQSPPGSHRSSGLPLFLLALIFAACSKKNEPPVPESETPPVIESVPVPIPTPAAPAADSAEPASSPASEAPSPEAPAAPAPAAAAKPVFRSKPPLKAWPGRAYSYQAVLHPARPFKLKVIEGPDSMRVSGAQISWTPLKAGKQAVTLEASWGTEGEGGEGNSLKQSFTVEVEPVFSLSLKPLPAQVDKGDTVLFDLKGSAFPEWAAPSLLVRFDHEGDGTWDTPPLPLASNLIHRHAYAAAGRFAPKVEARYLELESRSAAGSISVVSAVDARLVLKPDTVEPGGSIQIDASASAGDGRLSFRLDLDGDGKSDWADSSGGKGVLKAPSSGRYEARLTVRNPMGQEGKAAAPLLVNARPQAVLKLKAAKVHMAEPLQAALEAKDTDDSLRGLRINFTGDKEGWTAADAPDSAKGPGRWRKVFKHAYGKTGRFPIEACALSADGRTACAKAQAEVYNAQPVCEPGPELKATVGVPAEIEGKGKDPDGSIVKWEWDLNGDGKFDVASAKDGKVKYTFAKKGTFSLSMRVTTADGVTATAARKVEVRNKW